MISSLKNLKALGDERGQLIALESNNEIPFEIKRVFYIYGTQKGVPRGKHAHYRSKQFLISVHGSCKVTLDNGKDKETFELNSSHIGLFQDAKIWGEMHDFSSDCVLMVLANDYYNEDDYIRNYEEFVNEVNL